VEVHPQLVARARAGDRDAVAALYRACAHDIHGWIRGRIRDHHAAEDLTQQTFANALRALPRYEHREGAFPAWLTQIAQNAVIDHVRKNRKYALRPDPTALTAAPGGRAEAADALREAFARLEPAQREVTVLRHVVGLAPHEIADRLGRSVPSVDALHHRGRRALQRELLEREAMPTTA
jgi:RNA polymerase sigma-70 factor (ECF subfamily)